MPRQARLDAPGTLHHVIIRGQVIGDVPEILTYRIFNANLHLCHDKPASTHHQQYIILSYGV